MNVMKNLMCAFLIGAFSVSAIAEMKEHEYRAEVGGVVGCKIPKDASNPRAGECEVKKATFKTGTEIIKVGDQCQKRTTKLITMKNSGLGPHQVELPQLETSVQLVDCPT